MTYKVPTFAYRQGQTGYYNEMELLENPFNKFADKVRHAEWHKGWLEAKAADPLSPIDDDEDEADDADLETGFETDSE